VFDRRFGQTENVKHYPFGNPKKLNKIIKVLGSPETFFQKGFGRVQGRALLAEGNKRLHRLAVQPVFIQLHI
jgi:hypothetical protein